MVTRTEDGRTESTYRVNFEGLHEKVSRKMYEIINEGDVIQLKVTPYMKQVSFFKIDERVGWIENVTGERFAIFIFALAFFSVLLECNLKKRGFRLWGLFTMCALLVAAL